MCSDKEGCLGVVEDTWQWRSTFTILDTSCLPAGSKLQGGPPKTKITSWWFQPTHLKNMLVKLGSSSPNRVENKKHLIPSSRYIFFIRDLLIAKKWSLKYLKQKPPRKTMTCNRRGVNCRSRTEPRLQCKPWKKNSAKSGRSPRPTRMSQEVGKWLVNGL